ncbi:MAG: methyltransferase [Anaerolineaceae bacterium]|nr:methyltransferase [Anaerolineaceae bacterium]
MNGPSQDALDAYVSGLFAPEDDILQWIQAETRRNDMPQISLAPQEGRLLQFLMQAVGARTVVEIGCLAGYSGTWLARALPADGKLYTLEVSSKHAQVARNSFEKAGLTHQVELLEGPALESLQKLTSEGPFDFVFIDADKGSYPQYLQWAVDNLRPGGMVAAHNALRGGRVVNPSSADDEAMHAFNQSLADNHQLFSTIFALGDGMAVGIKQA